MTDERGRRIEDKIDHIQLDVREILVVQAKQHQIQESQAADLAHHIKRTDILEASVKPVMDFISTIRFLTKTLGILALLAGITEGAVALLEHINRVK